MIRLCNFYRKLIYKSRYWLYFIVALAIVWAVFAFVLAISFPATYPAFIGFLGETFGKILGDSDPDQKFELAKVLFKQNFIASFLDVAFGIVFGLVSVILVSVRETYG